MKRLLCLLTALCLLLCGCSSRVTSSTPAVTLGPTDAKYDAPSGTDGMTYTSTVALSLPSTDGTRLLTEYTQLTLDRTRHNARTIVEALLEYPSNERVSALGKGVRLSLYGRNPVEVSGGVCTVNLASTALQLEHSDFYTVCLALASTLSRLEDISYVNVLVCDQAVGMDIAGYLPTGTVSAHTGETLTTLWELMEARRTPLGQSAAAAALSTVATLYYPLSDGSGIMAETRNLIFTGQTPSLLAYGLLSALSSGAENLTDACTMPDIISLMIRDPVISEQADGSRLITLYFTNELEARLQLIGIEPMCFTAAVVCTLTTFIPEVSAVCVVSGSTMMTNLHSRTLGSLEFRNGNQRRTQYTDLLRSQVTVYLARNGRLVPVSRTLPASASANPANLLTLLSDGPTADEKAAGITAAIPAGFDEADVLGMAIRDDTLLINFSERFGKSVQSQTLDEQLLCYSLVTTLCKGAGLRRIRFWFAGDMEETMGGSLYWGGQFMLNPSMLQTN